MVEYLIPFKGLSFGKHDYQFRVGDLFFVEKKSELVKEGDLTINFTLDKQSRNMTSEMSIKGTIRLVCDRCIDKFDYHIDVTYHQIFKFANAPDIQEDDIIYLGDSEYQLDVSELILENILLQVPIKKVHPDNEDGTPACNPKQLKLINKFTKKTQTDPRWDALKNIKFDD
jgi:uncharacterized metal-binding protein YceD (DUF177 family)